MRSPSRRYGTRTSGRLRVDDDDETCGSLVERASRLAAWLREAGVRDGDRILIAGTNSTNLVVGCLAAMWSGGLEVVANPTLTMPELTYIAEDCGPAAVLADAGLLAGIESSVGSLPAAVLDRRDGPAPGIDERIAGVDAGLPAPRLEPGRGASIQYTSGTTGRPKGAFLTHANVLAHLRSLIVAWEWGEDDVLCHSLPLAHGHGRNGVFTALLAGATAIVLPRADPARIADTLASGRATVFYAVPAIWDRLLGWDGLDTELFRTVRLFTSGSAPLSPSVSDQIEVVLGSRPLERYGATETGIAVSNPVGGRRFAGTVGLPVPGAEVCVVDDAGDRVPDGEVGEIVVRGPAVFAGYWRRESAEYFHRGGWYRTGDLGRFDPERDRHLVITGRSKEMILTGGLNVYPREIELVAESLPAVREAVVVGIPSARWGEQVVMAVVPAGTAAVDVDELLSALRLQLAGYKLPKLCKVVAEIPRNHMGKPLRSLVAERWDTLTDPPTVQSEVARG